MAFSKSDILGLKISAGAGAALAIVAVFGLIAGGPDLDSNNCIIGEPHPNVVLLLDNTDSFSANQKVNLLDLAKQLPNDLEINDRLTIYVMSENSSFSPLPSLSHCRPASGDDTNPFIGNPDKVQKDFEERFANLIVEIFKGTSLAPGAQESPIIEFIEGIVSNLTSNGIFEISELIVVSDLFQNTPQLNQYALNSTLLDKVPAYYQSLSENIGRTRVFKPNTNIRITYLIREFIEDKQTNRHILFWEQVFSTFGVDLDSPEGLFQVDPVR